MKIRKFISQSIMWIVLIAALFVFSIPFLFMITNTFEEFSYVLPSPPKLFPDKINFAAYKHIFQHGGHYGFFDSGIHIVSLRIRKDRVSRKRKNL